MIVLVPLKRVPDPELKTKIKDDAVDLSNVSWVINPFDEYAVEAALRLVENADDGSRHGEVVVVTLGPEDAAQNLRTALAMGVDRAIRVDIGDDELDSRLVAEVLAKLYEEVKPDLLLLGKQAVDGDANQVAQMLAALLELPQATFAANIELAADKQSVTVGREADSGVEYKKIPLPGVVSVDLRIIMPKSVINNVTPDTHEYQEGPRYASLKGIMKAKKKPMDVKSLSDLGVDPALQVKQVDIVLPPERPGGQVVESVQVLVQKLHEEAKAI